MNRLVPTVIAIIIIIIGYKLFLAISFGAIVGFAQKGAEYFLNKIFPQEITRTNQKLRPDHKIQETEQINQKLRPDHKIQKPEKHKTSPKNSKKENSYPKLNVIRKKLGEVCNKEKCIEMYEYTYTTCSYLSCESSIKKVKKVRILNSKSDNKLSTI